MQISLAVRRVGMLLSLCAVLSMGSGCSMMNKGNIGQPVQNDELAPVTTMVESYGDIELPLDMALVTKESMAMRTDSFQGGVHVFEGRVEIASLRDYIVASMRNHKWKMVGEAYYNNVMLAFTKPNKTCMVVLSRNTIGSTIANFYVTVDVAAASRLNPFGEPLSR